jgi:SAM-dependent MidA family methyltransferase
LQIDDLIRERGPLTVEAFMDLALYDPAFGYYARAARRSGRAGDFFTSVDVGPLFGELLEVQIAEMASLLRTSDFRLQVSDFRLQSSDFKLQAFDLVEAGAGNGRLSADILRAAQRRDPDLFNAVRLHLVEASAEARGDQKASLGDVASRLSSSSDVLPAGFEGVLIANELLDAFPVHQVVMRENGLRETFVSHPSSVISRRSRSEAPAKPRGRLTTGDRRLTTDEWRLTTEEGAPSTPALAAYLDRLGVTLEPGWRVEINLRALDWIRDAAQRLTRGFIILIDYGHEAAELYSATHSAGTLTTYASHQSRGPESPTPSWLQQPGEQDITSHVDFTSVRLAAEAAGLTTVGFLDQTYFLLGLLNAAGLRGFDQIKDRLALKTLLMPGGLGSTHKVMIFSKGVDVPALQGLSFAVRVT